MFLKLNLTESDRTDGELSRCFSPDFSLRTTSWQRIFCVTIILYCAWVGVGEAVEARAARRQIWIYFVHVLYEKQGEIICKRKSKGECSILDSESGSGKRQIEQLVRVINSDFLPRRFLGKFFIFLHPHGVVAVVVICFRKATFSKPNGSSHFRKLSASRLISSAKLILIVVTPSGIVEAPCCGTIWQSLFSQKALRAVINCKTLNFPPFFIKQLWGESSPSNSRSVVHLANVISCKLS